MLVFLPNEPLHARIGLVDICRDWWFDILGVVDLVHDGISVRFHALFPLAAFFFMYLIRESHSHQPDPTTNCP